MSNQRPAEPYLVPDRPSLIPATMDASALRALTRLACARTSEEAVEALDLARLLLADEEQAFEPLLLRLSSLVGELEQLRRSSMLDELTGVGNLRAFNSALKREASRAQRLHQSYSVIMLDLDDLKVINDVHGHAAGDAAIRLVAQTCQAGLRASDVLARVGGDEFALLLPDTDHEGVLAVAARLRHCVGEQRVRDVTLRACLGVATCVEWNQSAEDVVARADMALYQEKRLRSSSRRERAA
jgi:diguanylate cyclase (GGDEF)-like protein